MKRAFLLGFPAISLTLFLIGIAGALLFHNTPYRIPWRTYEIILKLIAIAKPIYIVLFVLAIALALTVPGQRFKEPGFAALSFLNLLAGLLLFGLAVLARPISTVSPLNHCINNQRLIDSWINANGRELTNEIWVLITNQCRSGGNYSVSSDGVHCSIPDHNVPGDSVNPSSVAYLRWIRQFDQDNDAALSQAELKRASELAWRKPR